MTNSMDQRTLQAVGKVRRKTGHGGRRKGAGRPAQMKNAEMLSLRVERELLDKLAHLAGDEGVSSYVRAVLRRHVRSKRI